MGKRSPGRACGIMMSLMNLLHSSLGMLESRLKEIKAPSKDPSLSSTNDDVSEDPQSYADSLKTPMSEMSSNPLCVS